MYTTAKTIAGAAVLVSLFTANSARAFEPGRPFDRVSTSSKDSVWAYRRIAGLERAGFATGSPDDTFNGRRELTRYEFAVAVERIYRSLQPRVLHATETGTLRQSLFQFRRLLAEFAPDIAELGHDVTEMQTQVEALDQRLERLESSPSAPTGPRFRDREFGGDLRARGLSLSDRGASPALNDPFGLTALPASLQAFRPSGGFGLQPGLAARLGAARIGLKVEGPDPLGTVQNLPLEDPADGLGFQAQLSLPLGSYWLSAFYGRETAMADRYGLGNPYFQLGAASGLGGAVSGNLSERLAFRLETARFQSLADDLQRMIYLKGGLRYALGNGYSVDLGYEHSRQFGLPGSMRDGMAYTLGVGRNFGRNTSLRLLYRVYGDTDGAAGKGDNDSSAVTQLTVKF
ncbi:MAG: S-layer y domain [Armatimonadetes bacterium]|jgi:hypothetical protein|nr:S-layer y domain [Armatimonadota bacterium]